MRYVLLSMLFFCCLLSCGEENLFNEENEVQEENSNADQIQGVVVPALIRFDDVALGMDSYKSIVATPGRGSFVPIESSIKVNFDALPPANHKFIANRPVTGEPPKLVRFVKENCIRISLKNSYDEGEIKFRLFWDGGGIELDYTIYDPEPLQVVSSSVHDGATHFDLSRVNPITFSFNKKVTGVLKFKNRLGEELGWTGGVLSNETSTSLTPGPDHDGTLDNGTYRLTGTVKHVLGEEMVINREFSVIGKWKVDKVGTFPLPVYLRHKAFQRKNEKVRTRFVDILSNEFVFYTDKRWHMKLRYTYLVINAWGEEGAEIIKGDDETGVYSLENTYDHEWKEDDEWIEIVHGDRTIEIRLSEKNELRFTSYVTNPPRREKKEKDPNFGRVERKPLFVPEPVPAHLEGVKPVKPLQRMPDDFLYKTLVLIPKND